MMLNRKQTDCLTNWLLRLGGWGMLLAIMVAVFMLTGWYFQGQDACRVEAAPAIRPSAETSALRQELRSVEQELAAAEARAARRRARMPAEPRPEEFLEQIRVLAGTQGIQIGACKPGTPQAYANCWKFPVEISLHGSYRGLCGFVQGVSQLPRMSTIDGLEILEGDAIRAGHPAAIRLSVYYGLPGKTAAAKNLTGGSPNG